MISRSFITGTGLKKWVPMNLSGRLVTAAMAVMLTPEVLREEEALGLHDRLELLEDLLFDLQQLDDDLDDDVGIGGGFFQVDGGLDPAEQGVHVGLGALALLHLAGEVLLDDVHAAVDEALLDVAHGHLVARLGAHLGDPVAHQSRSQYTHFLDLHVLTPSLVVCSRLPHSGMSQERGSRREARGFLLYLGPRSSDLEPFYMLPKNHCLLSQCIFLASSSSSSRKSGWASFVMARTRSGMERPFR